MKFTAKVGKLKEELRPAFDISTKGVWKDHPDSLHVTLEALGNKLTASAFGGRLAITVSLNDPMLEYTCQDTGKATVNSVDLLKNLDAFDPDQTVNVSSDKELSITNSLDPGEVQSQPLLPDHVKMPEISDTPVYEIKVRRDAFVRGFSQIAFSAGFEDTKEQYTYWRFRADKGKVQFASGTGGRFAVFNIESSDVTKATEPLQILIPKEQTPVITGVLSLVDDEDITIVQNSTNSNGQFVFKLKDFDIILVGFDPNISWPDIERMIGAKKTLRIKTKRKDWKYPTKGLMATYNQDMKKEFSTHESDIHFDLSNQQVSLMSKHVMKSARKVPIVDISERQDDSDGIKIHCSTEYLCDIYKNLPKGREDIEVSIVDDTKPVFVSVEGPSPRDSKDEKEKFVMFFASLSE